MNVKPLVHVSDADTAKKSEKDLDTSHADEARKYLIAHAALRFVSDLIAALRENKLLWWTPAFLYKAFTPLARMCALSLRPDIRQAITLTLAGGKPVATRRKTPEDQAQAIVDVIDSREVTHEEFENEFRPDTLATYMDASAYVLLFLEKMPWDDNNEKHQRLVQGIIESLLKHVILSHWDVMYAIDRKVWQTYVPIETRMAIDEARLLGERDKKPLTAKEAYDIANATQRISECIPVKDLRCVLEAGVKKMGFTKPKEAKEEPKTEPEPDDKALTVPPKAMSGPPPLPKPSKPKADDNDGPDIHYEAVPEATTPPPLPKGTPHIPDAEFDAARARSGDMTPEMQDLSHSASSWGAQDDIATALGIDLKNVEIDAKVIEDLKTIFVDKKLIEDEARLRLALLTILPFMDPVGHPANGDWKGKLQNLNMMRFELKKVLMNKPAWRPLHDVLIVPKPPKPGK
ncbi:MAG: hypothetical protein V1745_02435 [Patescibacteria group bacterium]